MLKKFLPALALGLGVTLAHADEDSVRKAVESRLNTKVDHIVKTSYLDLYELFVDGQIIYTDEKQTVFFIGNLVDAKTMQSITEERLNKLTAIRFTDLPLERAIKQVRGDGKRVLVTFEDPNCGYCKRLAKDLLRADNVTVYTFLLPILGDDSRKRARQLWCSANRAKAWNEWMAENIPPTAGENCDTSAVTKNVELGKKLGITGTPTLFFADGERVPGAMPLANIEQKMNQKLVR
ncbi:MAG: hypothetical protein RIR00_1023 [Pseudomonadota bacterium]